MSDARHVREAFESTGAAAVMLARGALGNPWLFARLLEGAEEEPTPEEVGAELAWTIDRAAEHLGTERATRYLRKFYPWYVTCLGLDPAEAKRCWGSFRAPPRWPRRRVCCRVGGRVQALTV